MFLQSTRELSGNGLGNFRRSGGNKHLDLDLDLDRSEASEPRAPMVGLVLSDRCRQWLQVVGLTMTISRIVMHITAAHGFNRLPLGKSWCPIPITSMMLRRGLPTANPDRRVESCRLHKGRGSLG
jgi:hypothetical protein